MHLYIMRQRGQVRERERESKGGRGGRLVVLERVGEREGERERRAYILGLFRQWPYFPPRLCRSVRTWSWLLLFAYEEESNERPKIERERERERVHFRQWPSFAPPRWSRSARTWSWLIEGKRPSDRALARAREGKREREREQSVHFRPI